MAGTDALYDPRCEDLARVFLDDHFAHLDRERFQQKIETVDALAPLLARDIQAAIESFLTFSKWRVVPSPEPAAGP